jgi:hypothetical protein
LLNYALPYGIDKLCIIIAITICLVIILLNFRTGGLNANYRKLIMIREGYFLLLFFILQVLVYVNIFFPQTNMQISVFQRISIYYFVSFPIFVGIIRLSDQHFRKYI